MTADSIWTRIQNYLPAVLQVPQLTTVRVVAAFVLAVIVDGVQIALGPLGWSMIDELLDLVMVAATSALLGFHPLLLPTFVLELLPVADMLPTWTGCVGIVVGLRRREQRREADEQKARAPGQPG